MAPMNDTVRDGLSIDGWYVCTDLSFSLWHDEHFHSTASLHEGQNSSAVISLPHALQSITRLSQRLY